LSWRKEHGNIKELQRLTEAGKPMAAKRDYSRRDYSLTGPENQAAVARGLANAQWYRCSIPRKQMKAFMQREDATALRDTILWFLLFALFGLGGWAFWGTIWCVPFFFCYGVLYGSSTDSRWHECGHGTAFKTRWMNDVIYQIACFMVMREPEIWRWSHTRHHTDTIIVGRDPEIAAPRPPSIPRVLLKFLAVEATWIAVKKMLIHSAGRLLADEKTYVPEPEWPKVIRMARIWLAIHVGAIAWAIAIHSWLPLMYIGVLPTMYGAWLAVYFGLTQHVGLAEDVLDHRLNSRTVYMNAIFRYVYWNMNYHVEHHMFPMVPYHALPKLHEAVKDDTPIPCASTIEAYREIITAVLHQQRDPGYTVRRRLPPEARPYVTSSAEAAAAPAE
jgi:fatty acid desaturase